MGRLKLSAVLTLTLLITWTHCGLISEEESGGGGSGDGSDFSLTSDDMTSGGTLATTFTAGTGITGCTGSGSNTSPQLSWSNAPTSNINSLAVTLRDLDCTAGCSETGSATIHWIVYNIPTSSTSFSQGAGAASGSSLPVGALHARNDTYDDASGQVVGYFGPCAGGTQHTYEFKVWALSIEDLSDDATLSGLGGAAAATPTQVLTAIETHDQDSAVLQIESTGE